MNIYFYSYIHIHLYVLYIHIDLRPFGNRNVTSRHVSTMEIPVITMILQDSAGHGWRNHSNIGDMIIYPKKIPLMKIHS